MKKLKWTPWETLALLLRDFSRRNGIPSDVTSVIIKMYTELTWVRIGGSRDIALVSCQQGIIACETEGFRLVSSLRADEISVNSRGAAIICGGQLYSYRQNIMTKREGTNGVINAVQIYTGRTICSTQESVFIVDPMGHKKTSYRPVPCYGTKNAVAYFAKCLTIIEENNTRSFPQITENVRCVMNYPGEVYILRAEGWQTANDGKAVSHETATHLTYNRRYHKPLTPGPPGIPIFAIRPLGTHIMHTTSGVFLWAHACWVPIMYD